MFAHLTGAGGGIKGAARGGRACPIRDLTRPLVLAALAYLISRSNSPAAMN